MIILDATTETLQLVLAANITTNHLQYTTSFVDVDSTTYTPSNSEGLSNNTTDVDIVSAPSSGFTRQIKQITVYNNDTVNATLTIKKDVSGTDKILCKIILNSGDTLQYNDRSGFSVLSSTGIKVGSNSPPSISAGTQSVSTGTISFANSNGITFGMDNSSVITASISNQISQSFWDSPWADFNANAALTNAAAVNLSVQQIYVPFHMTVTRLDLLAHLTIAGSTAGSWTIRIGCYTRTGKDLYLASSTFSSVGIGSGGATSDTNSYSGVSGTRFRSISCDSWNFTPGEYWIGVINSISGVAGTTGSVTIYGQTAAAPVQFGLTESVVGSGFVFVSPTAGIFPNNIVLYNQSVGGFANRQPYIRMYGPYAVGGA